MKKLLFLILIGTSFILSCDFNSDDDSGELTPKQLTITDSQRELISESNLFGIELFRKISSESNLMISPLSASIALTMALNGADGNTATEMKSMLGYENATLTDINSSYQSLVKQLIEADSKVTLKLANAAFYENSFSVKSSFIDNLKTSFSAEVKSMDFSRSSSLDAINKWASDNTNGKITKVLNELSPDLVLILMNALYFKGDWTKQFEKDATENDLFYLSEEQSVSVPFMHSDINILSTQSNGLTCIELPYGRKNFSMILFVPDQSLENQYENLTSETWVQLMSSLNNSENWYSATIILPKFSFSYEKYLNEELQSLGMNDAFSPAIANFSGINDLQQIFISFVKQNTFVEVNEEGTEAAAVTTIGMELTSVEMPPQKPVFTFDKPFIFAIRERTTNTLLFIGSVKNPNE